MDDLLKRFAVIALLCLMGGCATDSKRLAAIKKATAGDGPPLHHIDIAKIPDATPKEEPRSRYGNPRSYVVFGKQYSVLQSSHGYKETGTASWYGRKFHGRRTSSGEPYDAYQMTAAHKSLPLPTYATVKNLNNGKEVIVKINDRGPFVDDRIIDLSYAAAQKLGITQKGTGRVQVTAINPRIYARKQKNKNIQLAKVESVSFKNDSKKRNIQPKQAVVAKNDKLERFYVQMGVFKNKKNATQLAKQTTHYTKNMKFLDVYVLEGSQLHAPSYAVRVGPFTNSDEAEQIKHQLGQATRVSPRVVKDILP